MRALKEQFDTRLFDSQVDDRPAHQPFEHGSRLHQFGLPQPFGIDVAGQVFGHGPISFGEDRRSRAGEGGR